MNLREELMAGMGGDVLDQDEIEIMEAADIPGLGEDLQRAADMDLLSPKAGELAMSRAGKKPPPVKFRPKPKGVPSPGGRGTSAFKTVRTIDVIPNEVVVSNFQIANTGPFRVDLGIDSRTDILIANMSLSPIWVNVVSNISNSVGQFTGVPLRAMSGANQFDGGVLRVRCTSEKRWWAQAVAAGTHLVVAIESALRE